MSRIILRFRKQDTYRVVRQWWIIRKPLETSGNRSWRFTAGFRIFYILSFFFFKKKILIEKSGNLPETSAAGFQRFPEVSGSSLTDHTVHSDGILHISNQGKTSDNWRPNHPSHDLLSVWLLILESKSAIYIQSMTSHYAEISKGCFKKKSYT